MAEVKLMIQMPMDCHRQQIRHRTASVNEYSTRFSEAIDDKQETKPDAWRLQSTANKQGSSRSFVRVIGENDPIEDGYTDGNELTADEKALHSLANAIYKKRLRAGVAREQARKDLPLSTYTRYYWKIDLNNLLKYLFLRMDAHAQHEIRQYATAIGKQIVAVLFPLTWEAFLDYRHNAITLSALEIAKFAEVFKGALLCGDAWKTVSSNARECEEFREKLRRLGFNVGTPDS
jgi:thymidylate synthase (FAD)